MALAKSQYSLERDLKVKRAHGFALPSSRDSRMPGYQEAQSIVMKGPVSRISCSSSTTRMVLPFNCSLISALPPDPIHGSRWSIKYATGAWGTQGIWFQKVWPSGTSRHIFSNHIWKISSTIFEKFRNGRPGKQAYRVRHDGFVIYYFFCSFLFRYRKVWWFMWSSFAALLSLPRAIFKADSI